MLPAALDIDGDELLSHTFQADNGKFSEVEVEL